MRVFISGSIGISKLPKCAITKIDNIITKGMDVIVGDAKGVDLAVQKYLFEKKYDKVIVYYAGNIIRNNYGNWKTRNIENSIEKGKKLYTLKDIEMANDSDYGLMIWDGKSDGTKNNILKMKEQKKKFFVIIGELVIDDLSIDHIIKFSSKINEEIQLNLF